MKRCHHKFGDHQCEEEFLHGGEFCRYTSPAGVAVVVSTPDSVINDISDIGPNSLAIENTVFGVAHVLTKDTPMMAGYVVPQIMQSLTYMTNKDVSAVRPIN